tara:strand:- start:367 stop:579 length:213 start_codon:yes stop_codon:yes gene_type:complete
MTEAEQRFLAKVDAALLKEGVDPTWVAFLIDDMRAEKETVGGNLVAICWAVLVDSGFYKVAAELQSWSVE